MIGKLFKRACFTAGNSVIVQKHLEINLPNCHGRRLNPYARKNATHNITIGYKNTKNNCYFEAFYDCKIMNTEKRRKS